MQMTLANASRLFLGGTAGNVFRGMAKLALGSGAARLVGFLSIPVITRLYAPADMGVLSVFMALTAMLVPLVTFRYVVAIPLPRADGVAMNLIALCGLLILIVATLVGVVMWAFGPTLLGLLSMEALVPWWWLFVIGLLGAGSYEVLTLWATRRRSYRIIAYTKMTQSVLGAATKIGLGLLAWQPLGLLLGQVVSYSAGIGTLLWRFREDFRINRRWIGQRRIKHVAYRYSGFPIYRMPSQLLMVFSMQAPLLFAAALYEPQVVGQLGLAMMVLNTPVNLLGNAMGRAFYGEIAALNKKEKLGDISKLVQIGMFFAGLPICIVFYLFSGDIFEIVFGTRWTQAGQFAGLMCFPMLLRFTSSPLMNALNVLGAQYMFLFINIFRGSGLVAIYFIAERDLLMPIDFVVYFVIFNTVFYSAQSAMIFLLIRRYDMLGKRT